MTWRQGLCLRQRGLSFNVSQSIQRVQIVNRLTEILIQRLEKKGVEQTAIPGFMRNLANIISVTPHMNLREVNRKLHLLGWTHFELDDHTLQLTIASFEVEALKSSGNKPGRLFDTN